ncbi:MAG: hypothetical protein V4709_12485 [Pseudomonadota bacterium]
MKTLALSWLCVCAALLPTMTFAQSDSAPLFELEAGIYAAGSGRELRGNIQGNLESFEAIDNASRGELRASLNFAPLRIAATYERGLRNDRAGIMPERQRNLTLDSALGKLLVGDAPSAFRTAGERLDPFFDTALSGFNGRVLGEGAGYGLSNLTNSVTRNSLAYSTPELFGGLKLNAGGYLGTKDAPNDEIDRGVGIAYEFKNLLGEGNVLQLGAQGLQIENPTAFALGNSRLNRRSPVGGSPGESDNIRLHAAFATPRFSLGVSAEHIDVKAEPKARGYLFTSATVALNANLRLAASYGKLDFKTGSPALSGDSYALGLFARLGESVNGYIGARRTLLDNHTDATVAAIGLSFSLRGRLFAAGGGAAPEAEPVE